MGARADYVLEDGIGHRGGSGCGIRRGPGGACVDAAVEALSRGAGSAKPRASKSRRGAVVNQVVEECQAVNVASYPIAVLIAFTAVLFLPLLVFLAWVVAVTATHRHAPLIER